MNWLIQLKKHRKPFLFWVFSSIILIFSPLLSPAQNLSLSESVAYALEHNEEILKQKEAVSQRKYEYAAMKGNFLPKIDAAGGYTWLSENMEINMSQVKGSMDDILSKYGVAIANEVIPVQTSPEFQQGLYHAINGKLSQMPTYNLVIDNQDMPTANIVATQPIFMGGKIIAGTKFAKAEMNEAGYELVKLSNEVVQVTIQRYLTAVLLHDVVNTRKEVLAGMEKHRDEAQRAIEIGVVPPHVILRAEVAVSDAKRKLKDDENNLNLAIMALKTQMGMRLDSSIIITDKLQYNIHEIMLENSLQEADANQPIFQILEQKKVMVRQNYNVKRSEMLPKIVAWGEYGFFRDELPIIQPPIMLGVQVKLNLFNGFKHINELKAASHLEQEMEYAESHARSQINLWINKSFVQVINSQNKYLDMQSTISLAKENLRINEKRFSEGLTPSLDVLDARLVLEGELVEELVSLYEYYSALSEFYTATGQPEKVLDIFNQQR